jgi:hypothetical protein
VSVNNASERQLLRRQQATTSMTLETAQSGNVRFTPESGHHRTVA